MEVRIDRKSDGLPYDGKRKRSSITSQVNDFLFSPFTCLQDHRDIKPIRRPGPLLRDLELDLTGRFIPYGSNFQMEERRPRSLDPLVEIPVQVYPSLFLKSPLQVIKAGRGVNMLFKKVF